MAPLWLLCYTEVNSGTVMAVVLHGGKQWHGYGSCVTRS